MSGSVMRLRYFDLSVFTWRECFIETHLFTTSWTQTLILGVNKPLYWSSKYSTPPYQKHVWVVLTKSNIVFNTLVWFLCEVVCCTFNIGVTKRGCFTSLFVIEKLEFNILFLCLWMTQYTFNSADVESPSPEPDGEFKSTAPPLDVVFTTNPSLLQTNGTLPHAGGVDAHHREDDESATSRYFILR